MLLELAVGATAILGLASVSLVAITAYRSRAALNNFKKKLNGVPMVERHWLYNNALYPFMKDVNHKISELHKEGGDFLGWLYRQQFAVSTIDLDIIKLINQDEVQKHIDKIKTDLPMKEFAESLVSVGGENWRRSRRVFASALKQSKFKTPVVIGEIKTSIGKLISHIERQIDERSRHSSCDSSATFESDEISHRYTMDLVLRCFYRQRDQVDFDTPHCEWTSTMVAGFKAMQESKVFKLAIIFPVLVPIVDWLMWHFHPMGHFRQRVMRFVKEQTWRGIEMRRQAHKNGGEGGGFERNISDFVIDQFLEGKLTKDQYLNSSCLMMTAADKTSADAIAHTIYVLAVNKHVQDKLRECIRSEGGHESEYLSWVINESLRLLPPAANGCGRIITRDITTKEGYTLPKGTFLLTPAFTIHRLEKYWGKDAEEFKPERWADTSQHHPFQYMPFGGGIRGCPGREFALFQMKMLLAELLTRYSFTCEPKADIYHFDSPFLQTTLPHSPTYVTIERVQDDKSSESDGKRGNSESSESCVL